MSTAVPKCDGVTSYKAITATPTIHKGWAKNSNKTKILCWDMIGSCDPECGIKARCGYVDGRGLNNFEYSEGKKKNICFIQKKYLDTVYEILLGQSLPNMDEKQSIELGLSIMPLFGHLVKMKISEVSVDSVLLIDKQGKKYANPIYREMRETIKLINVMMESYGVNTSAVMKGLPDLDFANGDPTYYDRMIKYEEGFDRSGNDSQAATAAGQNGEGEGGEEVELCVHDKPLCTDTPQSRRTLSR
jgi:hypothetical protein